jgi:hypothetical protein
LAFGGLILPLSISDLSFVLTTQSGVSADASLLIRNNGDSTLTISNIICPNGFYSGLPLIEGTSAIALGSFGVVQVTFEPTSATFYGGSITVESDATAGTNTIPVSGWAAVGPSALTLVTNGNGAVSPNLNGKSLMANKPYTLRAVAGNGSVFSNWSGSITSTKNPLTFTTSSAMLLQANFVPNPFLAVQGKYNGLFSTTNGVTEETAGALRGLAVGKNGAYSGTILIDGGRHVISGNFNLSGQATNYIVRDQNKGGPFTVVMAIPDP